MSEEPVGDAVKLPNAVFAPFTPTLSEVSEPLHGDVGVERFGELDDFISYLPHPRPHVASLLSTELLEFKASTTSGAVIPMLLELGSTFLEAELPGRNVLPTVGLLQNPAFADYGYRDFGAVDVYAHPVWSGCWVWSGFGENSEEAEVPLHYHAGQLPTILKVFLKSPVGSVSAYGNADSDMVQARLSTGFPRLVFLKLKSRWSKRTTHFPISPSTVPLMLQA